MTKLFEICRQIGADVDADLREIADVLSECGEHSRLTVADRIRVLGADRDQLQAEVTALRADLAERAKPTEQAMPDGSDKPNELSRNMRNLHGWSIEEWIAAIKRQPERTLPNGVGGALVAYYEQRAE
jgi:hypothetical protein